MTPTRSLMFSTLGHILCVAALIMCSLAWNDQVKHGEQQEQLISSYMVAAPPMIAAQSTEITQTENKTIALNTIQTKATKNLPKQAATFKQVSKKGEPMPELIALLHAAIQKAQRYPASAQEMEREGRTTLAFTLHANGTVSGLKILRSSGTPSLDNAALAAVSNAVPFQQVEHYLNASQPYQIDVVFSLS